MRNLIARAALFVLVVLLVTSCGGGSNGSVSLVGSDRGKQWGEAQQISDNPTEWVEFQPQIAVGGDGSVFVVWTGTVASRNAWVLRYSPTGGWESSMPLENSAFDAMYVEVAADADGNAIAVWQQQDGSRYQIWARHYTQGVGWDSPQIISSTGASINAENAEVEFDGLGNALAVWRQYDSDWRIWSNRFVAGVGWQGPVEVPSSAEVDTSATPRLTVDPLGNALVVWDQDKVGGFQDIWSNRYIANSGWGSPALVETSDTLQAELAQIDSDQDGNALAVWVHTASGQAGIWANRYTVGSGWGTPEPIESLASISLRPPQIAVNDDGTGFAVWAQTDVLGRYNVWANRYRPGSGWGAEESIFVGTASIIFDVHVATARQGSSAVAVWLYPGSSWEVFASVYSQAEGWAEARRLDDGSGTSFPHVIMDNDGDATAVWAQFNGVDDDVWSSRFE